MILRLHEVARSHGAGRQRYRLRVPALELRAGRQLAIVGPSGCGKSTLLDLLALALAPDPGGRFEFLAGERGGGAAGTDPHGPGEGRPHPRQLRRP
ncbi:ATP-binding cassette domain-containing protein, partial [Pseudomonas aeruginosa]|uniref:ATP-binding cassette domain-containing protein n=1 Tax=Pseudomonas aeruginosa TaxID=287 RepID=UPI0020C8F61F